MSTYRCRPTSRKAALRIRRLAFAAAVDTVEMLETPFLSDCRPELCFVLAVTCWMAAWADRVAFG